MNPNMFSNVTLLTLAFGSFGLGFTSLQAGNLVQGVVAVAVGVVFLFLYEKFPPSLPPQA